MNNDNKCRISDNDLIALIDPQGTILANLAAIKSKGYKISKDRIAKFLKKDKEIDNKEIKDKEIDNKEIKDKEIDNKEIKDKEIDNKEIKDKEIEDKEIKDKEIDNTMDYNNDLEDAFETLNNNRLHIVCTNQNSSTNKTLTRKAFNNTINQMLHELQNTLLKDFDAKKEEIVNWAKYNFYKISDKDRPFETFMNGLRVYISKLKEQAPRRTLEERKAEAAKRLTILLDKLENAQNDYEFGTTENQIYSIVDSFNNPEKSNGARVKLNELRLKWELKHNNPF